MKKILFTICFVAALAGSSFAQIEQGTVLVGPSTNLGFTSSSFDGADSNLTTFNIDLAAGYFVIENLAVGLSFGYLKVKYEDIIDESTTSFGLFGRYYVNGKIFVGAGYSSSKSGDSDAFGSLPLEVGYAAFITDNIAVEPSFGYELGLGDNDTNTFGLNVGFMLYLNR
ncbi:MAG TPA: outer membrane beta-barrel protein [Cyclobacteriaceae bacterium]|nr:outer membrane beta-barrel protein [Cyclobacteriaceae bacterium]